MNFTHDTYLSPYTWRYGSDAMRHIWSEIYRRKLWRRIWVALAQAQQQVGLTTPEQVADLRAHQEQIDLERAHIIEQEIQHDLMAEVHTYAEQCPIGGGILHLGMTSMDVEDNAEALRLREALGLHLERLGQVLHRLAEQIERHAETVCMGYTHLQPAEPTTVGYRLAFYAQDLLADWHELTRLRGMIRGKGVKGAVGTAASYEQLLQGTSLTAAALEAHLMASLELEPFAVSHQTYTRRQDWLIVNALAGMGITLYKFAFDLRLLQSPMFGEWREPFGKKQIGSSAMPFKRNPIHAENMDSLARLLATLPRVMWDNAAHSLLERTLDDSGNRRSVLPEACLIADELLIRMARLVDRLTVDEVAVNRQVRVYGVFSATERVLMEATRRGANRQHVHELIRTHSLTAWEALQTGQPNPLSTLLMEDATLNQVLSAEEVGALLDASAYVGIAPQRSRELATQIKAQVQ